MDPKRASKRSIRPLVGYLTPTLSDSVSTTLWSGIVDAAAQHDTNLITVVGGRLDTQREKPDPTALLYRWVGSKTLKGLVSWASAIGGTSPPEAIERFHQRYRDLPMVSLGTPIQGSPTLVVDSYHGMREAVEHLIDIHARHRVAFVRGPSHHAAAQERYAAYADGLRERGIPLNPRLVTPPGPFAKSTGAAAVQTLIDKRNLSPGHDFDALITVSDLLAVGALKALQNRGVRIPNEVAVIGCNDGLEALQTVPALTSVTIPFNAWGQRAIETILALIREKPVPEQRPVRSTLSIRRSCGCLSPAIAETSISAADEDDRLSSSVPLPEAEALLALMRETYPRHDLGSWREVLIPAFLHDLENPHSTAFITQLEHAVHDVIRSGNDVAVLQSDISALRRHGMSSLQQQPERAQRAKTILDQAQILIGESASLAMRYQSVLAQQNHMRLNHLLHALTAATDLDDLSNVLVRELPALGIPAVYLVLYENTEAPETGAHLHLAFDERGRIRLPAQRHHFQPTRILPWELLRLDHPQALVMEALHFQDEAFGYVIFEVGTRDGQVYDILREQISVALKSVRLLNMNVALYHQSLEAQKAAEEANRLKSRFLSMVSHELRLPLSLLVGLSQMLLREQAQGRFHLPEPYQEDLARIHVSARQLDGLITDVLDLTQSHVNKLRLTKAPLDLREVIEDSALVGAQMAREKGLNWHVEIPNDLPWMMGDRTRLRQVLLNLISNAVKFTPSGSVTLSAAAHRDRVTIAVKDTGLGVPLDEQTLIFDEFRQSERTAARGYGGLGVGLALCRTLVELHGGTIEVESSGRENEGSTFTITLPILNLDRGASTTPSPSFADVDGRIAVLCANAGDSEALRNHLADRSIEAHIIELDPADTWITALQKSPPSAIILNLGSASDRGWDLRQELKRRPALKGIPIFFYTALKHQASGPLMILEHLSKPLDTRQLRASIARQGLAGRTGGEQPTLLVVDDDAAVLDFQVRLVRDQLPGCRVLTAENGRRAMEIIHCVRPDLILLDLRMPEMDGFAVLEAMSASPTLRTIPVIVLTAKALTPEEIARMNHGVAAILSKGVFSAEEVVNHLQEALTSHQGINPETRQRMRLAMAFIQEHHAEPISRSDIAEHVNLCDSYLSSCFQQEFGVAPMTYLMRYRIMQAKRLLEISDESILDIALDVGFSSGSYFGRVFHREVGVTPSAYRRGERAATQRPEDTRVH